MLRKILWDLVFFAGFFLLGFFLGFKEELIRCELEKTEFQNVALEKQAQADRKTQDVENAYKDAIVNAQSEVSLGTSVINAKFWGIDRGLFNSVDYSVHHNKASTDNTNALSNNTEPTAGVQTTSCRCDRQDRAKLQRLYEEQLVIARDCDITTTYYNKILELWDKIKTTSN